MKRATIAVMLIAVAPAAFAEKTNTLDALQQANQKQQHAILGQYGKALDTIMADVKKKGDLNSVLILQAEQKRFGEEKVVPVPADAKDSFRPAAAAYYRSMVALLGQYVKMLDLLIKQEVTADRIEEAKLVKEEKDKAVFMLADLQTKTQMTASTAKTTSGKRSLPDELRRGLVLHFTFDANDGAKVVDASENRLDGTVSGAKWVSEPGRGGCYRFDGKEGHICVPHSGALSFDRAVTMSMWLKPVWLKTEGRPQSALLMEKWVNGQEDKALYVVYPAQNKVGIGGFLWGVGSVSSESTFASASWCHVASTYDGAELKVYVDGVLSGTTKASGSIRNATGNLYIGSSRGRAAEGLLDSQDFKGLLDEAMIYDRTLSASEVKELYELQK